MIQEKLNQALLFAAGIGDADKVAALIKKGADVGAFSGTGEQPLHFAAQNGRREVVDLLIACGADVNGENHSKRQPLHFVAYNGRGAAVDVMKLLVANGAQLDAADVFGQRPLHRAAQNGQKEMVEILLGCGADPTADDDHHNKPGDLCMWEIAKVLEEAERQWKDPLLRKNREQEARKLREKLAGEAIAEHLLRQRKLGSLRMKGPSI